MILRLIFLLLIFLPGLSAHAQNLPIGSWRVHLPYNDAIAVAEGNDRIYCASRNGLFSYSKKDGSTEILSKVTGLADVEISTINYHKDLDILVVAYKNTNIDLIEGNRIFNMSDIKRKNIPGKKSINNILMAGNYAYLSCGFGIVVIDLVKKEIKDTYFIGPGGSSVDVLDLAYDGSSFFAATASGVFQAPATAANLADYSNWIQHTGLPAGKYNTICHFNQKIYANLFTNQGNDDTLMVYDGTSWSFFYGPSVTWPVYSLRSYENYLVVVNDFSIEVYDVTGTRVHLIYQPAFNPRHALVDKNQRLWIADFEKGLIKSDMQSQFEYIRVNGPGGISVNSISISGNRVWVAPGGKNVSWAGLYNPDGIFAYSDNQWTNYNKYTTSGFDTLYDFICIAIDPQNSHHIYAGTWGKGLVEMENGKIKNTYTQYNSSLKSQLRIGGVVFDADGNLWVTNSEAPSTISVKTPGGTWKDFSFPGLINNHTVGGILLDDFNQKWVILPRGHGILVFSDNGTITNTSDDRVKKLSDDVGNGALPSPDIRVITKDREGEIWVGTDKGICVFYSPGDVFSGNNFDSQRILIEQDGNAQYLLESETVAAIAVDGANRKWIGTQNGGAFLMSRDGTKELLHFTAENSPLLSNTIYAIAINDETGEVFFGTERGIISYRGTATEGGDDFENVYVFPNPVRENYSGTIAISGLAENVNVKITDVSGNLVYETVANGGMATWNGKNFQGEKVHTGVYLVFCSNSDGTKTFVTKILFVN